MQNPTLGQHPYSKYMGTPNYNILRDIHSRSLLTGQSCEAIAKIMNIDFKSLSWDSESSLQQVDAIHANGTHGLANDSSLLTGDVYETLRKKLRLDL